MPAYTWHVHVMNRWDPTWKWLESDARNTNRNPQCSWQLSFQTAHSTWNWYVNFVHSEFRSAFRWLFRVSSFRERAVRLGTQAGSVYYCDTYTHVYVSTSDVELCSVCVCACVFVCVCVCVCVCAACAALNLWNMKERKSAKTWSTYVRLQYIHLLISHGVRMYSLLTYLRRIRTFSLVVDKQTQFLSLRFCFKSFSLAGFNWGVCVDSAFSIWSQARDKNSKESTTNEGSSRIKEIAT